MWPATLATKEVPLGRKNCDFGFEYHEPPYTEEEQMAFYKSSSMTAQSSFTRPSGAAPQATQTPVVARPASADKPRRR